MGLSNLSNLIKVDFKFKNRVTKLFTVEQFLNFLRSPHHIIEKNYYVMISKNQVETMSIWEYMLYLKYSPEMNTAEEWFLVGLFEAHPQKEA
jgi:hypothetical protein